MSMKVKPPTPPQTHLIAPLVWMRGTSSGAAAAIEPFAGQLEARVKKWSRPSDEAPRKKKKSVSGSVEDDAGMSDAPIVQKPPHRTHGRSSSTLLESDDELLVAKKVGKTIQKLDRRVVDDEDDVESSDSDNDEYKRVENNEQEELDTGDVDLEGLGENELKEVLDSERPEWTATNAVADTQVEDAELSVDVSSQPARRKNALRVVESEDSDSDPGLQAGMASLKAAQKARPVPRRTQVEAGLSAPPLDLTKVVSNRVGTANANARLKGKTRAKPATVSRTQAVRAATELQLATWNNNIPGPAPLRPARTASHPPTSSSPAPLQPPRTASHPATSSPAPLQPSRTTPPPYRPVPPRDVTPSPNANGEGTFIFTASDEAVVSPYKVQRNARQGVNIKAQVDPVEDALHVALDYLSAKLLGTTFYPVNDTLMAGARRCMIKAIRSFDDPKLTAMLSDKAAMDACSRGLVQRVPNIRSPAKSITDGLMHPDYHVTEATPDRAKAQKTGMTYIYALTPETVDRLTGNTIPGHPNTKRPYSHDSIAHAAAFLFRKGNGRTLLGQRLASMFPVNENGNREATPALVALAATAIYSSLDDYSTTPYKRTGFEGGRIEHAYRIHMKLLKEFEAKQPIRYHETLEKILRVASGEQVAGTSAPSSLETDAFAMVDFTD
ncbi:hypothetical protein GGX14DRAFT_579977 [Mycena pura]|uniref:DUF6532 domain-containing protein n=1 Tax=Mycena pura TaxID=153505 RepID=A0AAD6Y3S0_9AGAR|nr:hypothetical protein GGX14DRAFT_579977 [Mycena pura]